MSCGKAKKEEPVKPEPKKVSNVVKPAPASVKPAIPKKDVAVISTMFGDMVIEFFDGAAPKHVESFKFHARSGYYDGTLFHRVMPGFMIQGGDPNTRGENKASYGSGGHAAKYYGMGRKMIPAAGPCLQSSVT